MKKHEPKVITIKEYIRTINPWNYVPTIEELKMIKLAEDQLITGHPIEYYWDAWAYLREG